MSARPYRELAPVEPDPAPGSGQSEAARLGSLISVHVPPPLYLALIGPLVVAGLLTVAAAVSDVPLYLLPVVGVVAFAFQARWPLRIRGWSTALHAQGLVLSRPRGRRVVAFDDVNEVWFEIDGLHSRGGAYLRALRLVDFSGEEHRLPLAVHEGATLANSVLRGCSGPLLLEARRALGEGETLTFGQTRLDRAGITIGGARATWPEIRLAIVSHGRLHLYRRLPILAWRTLRLDRVPNPAVLVGLVAHCAPTRIDDPLLAPLASEAEIRRARSAGGGNEAALRAMLVGGLLCVAGILVGLAVHSANSHGHRLAYIPIVYGAIRFFQGLVALRSGPRK